MTKRGGERWQLWAAGFGLFALMAGAVAGCDDEETTDPGTTATGSGTGTGTATTSTGTGTGTAGTTSTTTDDGCGGAAACQLLCDEAQAKFTACMGGGVGGGGGAGGDGAGGGTTWNYDCDEMGQCYSFCIEQASCDDIRLQGENYATCVGCCNDPYLC